MSNAATFPPHSPSNELGPIIYFPPFDEVGTDIILRSSDGVDFHVYRVVLSLASPFFKQMFSLPQPESATPVPVIPVAEASGILDLVLRLWYPGANPATFTGLEQLAQVIEITVAKYDVGLGLFEAGAEP
ncbi:hypothetical protein B0H11DRAFT_755389 [Mycena galericulata]|nr:hypothetical protein B0H11DRAFT_755389 [Mycena galericulata]